VLFAQLVDDPSAHPDEFPTESAQAVERQRLFSIIERLVVWENLNDESLIAEAQSEIYKSCDGDPPAILDPFAGGGSIPLEAQRLGLHARASDLNPVSVLINKALIEVPPLWSGLAPVFPESADERMGSWIRATGLAEDVRRYGKWMRDQAEQRIGQNYPDATLSDGTRAPVIAWIWARTVTCPNPACSITLPLVRSWWLGKKKGKEAYIVPSLVAPAGGRRRIEFTIGHSLSNAPTRDSDGTVTRNGAICLACDTAVPLAYVRSEGKAGRLGTQLMATVAEGDRRREYLPPSEEQEEAAAVPAPTEAPDTELPEAALGFRVQGYGMAHHADLFTARQLTAMVTFADLVSEARAMVYRDGVTCGLTPGDSVNDGLESGGRGAAAYADSVAIYLAFAVSRLADYACTITTWASNPQMEILRNVFSRQAISMTWDFAEGSVFGPSSGTLDVMLQAVARTLDRLPASVPGLVTQEAAQRVSIGQNVLVSTDPPYYDNVGYADLSDFFYVWLRRSLGHILPETLGTILTPKTDELVADPFRHGGAEQAGRFFEEGFADVFARIRDHTPLGFPITVFYAFKQAESDEDGTASTGWQTLLEGMLRGGWEVTATWPVRTERAGRARDIGSNALASSIVLACRPRATTAEAVSRRSFLTALKAELPRAMRDLQQSSIAPVDLAQAAIGPGMAVFSRYTKVVEADGSDMSVRTALALINQSLDEVLTEQEGDFDADTRFCVKWFSQFGWDEGSSGEADVLARATNTSVDGLIRGGVFRAIAGRATLQAPDQMQKGWDPATDERISDWEVVLRLAKALDEDGSEAAVQLMAASSQRVELEAAKELAYLLFSIAEKKGWTATALLFNGLGTSWSELSTAARLRQGTAPGSQGVLGFDNE
jgi:putative DNA methylase